MKQETKRRIEISNLHEFADSLILIDNRIERCKKHQASTIVLIAISAVICGADTWNSIEDFGKSKVKLVRVDHGQKSQLILHIHNIWSAFETLLFLSFSPFCTIKRFTERDARRTRRFLISIEILVAIILIVASVSIFSVLEPIPEMESVSLVCKMIKS